MKKIPLQAFADLHGNTRASALLGMNYVTLWRWLKRDVDTVVETVGGLPVAVTTRHAVPVKLL